MPHAPSYANARALHRANTVVFTPRKDCSEVAGSDSPQLETAAELKIKFSNFAQDAFFSECGGQKARFSNEVM
jgi:hypothetical protein